MGQTATQFLSGWKEIANYLGKGVRTVQRYERELHLPIRRPAGKSAAAVMATTAEIDDWVIGSPRHETLAATIQATFHKTHSVGADFLRIDSEIALTLIGLALASRDAENRRRMTQTARTAYDTIMRLRKNIRLEDMAKEKLDTNLHRLRSELRKS